MHRFTNYRITCSKHTSPSQADQARSPGKFSFPTETHLNILEHSPTNNPARMMQSCGLFGTLGWQIIHSQRHRDQHRMPYRYSKHSPCMISHQTQLQSTSNCDKRNGTWMKDSRKRQTLNSTTINGIRRINWKIHLIHNPIFIMATSHIK